MMLISSSSGANHSGLVSALDPMYEMSFHAVQTQTVAHTNTNLIVENHQQCTQHMRYIFI